MIMDIKTRWSCRGGYKEVFGIAIPLILSTGAWSIQHFVDRMFLTWYSPEAIAASVPAAILNFTVLSFFIGTGSYVSTFVAQYYGAEKYDRVGAAVWQGIYFSLTSIVTMMLLIPLSDTIFELAGHSSEIRKLENQYFIILCMGGFFPVVASAVSGFFSGLGNTWTVMWVNALATALNMVLDYLLIFGRFGFPEMGIRGAAIATVISAAFSALLFFGLMFRRIYREKFKIIQGIRFERELFTRLWKFGSPAGAQFFVDMLGFTLFLLLIGRYGKIELAATNIAFNINGLAFMPMIGFGIAVSVLVGQNLGNRQPEEAEFATWSAVHIGFVYMASIAVLYIAIPKVFLAPFGMEGDQAVFEQIMDFGVVLLRFIAFYSLFDAFVIIFSSAVKGAGDTKFVMKAVLAFSWILLVIPTFFAVVIFDWHLFVAWGFATIYIVLLGILFLHRFQQGKWKTMLVIETTESQQEESVPKGIVFGK